MPRMTSLEFDNYQARRRRQELADNMSGFGSTNDHACEQESELHQQIIDECGRREWAFVHSRLDRPSTVAVGTADFVIIMDGGRCAFVEAKRKNAKATPDQLAFIAHCKKLGHVAGVVWSFSEFLELVKA